MTWPKWVLIAYLVLSVVLNVRDVGKPRRPISASTAAIIVLFAAVLIVLVVLA